MTNTWLADGPGPLLQPATEELVESAVLLHRQRKMVHVDAVVRDKCRDLRGALGCLVIILGTTYKDLAYNVRRFMVLWYCCMVFEG